MEKPRVLAIIPARGGSKRIPRKNTRRFCGSPLVAQAVKQARALSWVDRVIVDTDSPQIAALGRASGADVPYLRPKHLAQDASLIIDSIRYLLAHLKRDESYTPDFVLILQPTSPLRVLEDIEKCWALMKKGGATTILTVAPTHPRLYTLDKQNYIHLANGSETMSTNMQAWPQGYLLNGCFAYIVKTNALLKQNRIITKKTKAIVCPKWRSIDLDTTEEWVLAEYVYKNRKKISRDIKNFT